MYIRTLTDTSSVGLEIRINTSAHCKALTPKTTIYMEL